MVYLFYFCAHIDARATGDRTMRSTVMMALPVAMLPGPMAGHRSLCVLDGAVFKAAATLIKS
jgi:hypothetical protein